MRAIESYPGTLCVCIDEIGPDTISGRFYHRYDKGPVIFDNPFQMIITADKIFNHTGAPMAFFNERSFKNVEKKNYDRRISELNKLEEVVNHKGDKATFIVNVQYRQHASWQGKITWMEGKKNCSFRSILELIKLMDSAVENEGLHLWDYCGEEEKQQREPR